MTTRTLVLTTVLIAAGTGPMLAQPPASPTSATQPGQAPRARTGAQTPEPVPPPPPPAPPVAASRRNGQPVNVKIEFTITDQRGGGPAVKRTVALVVADAHTGQIRSVSDVAGISTGVLPLNVDTTPELLTDGKIRLGFNLQYDWAAPLDGSAPPARGTVMKTAMHDSVSLILESGKSMIAAQSADPIGDRQVTVEVKATILK
jgi:hypothetical protein